MTRSNLHVVLVDGCICCTLGARGLFFLFRSKAAITIAASPLPVASLQKKEETLWCQGYICWKSSYLSSASLVFTLTVDCAELKDIYKIEHIRVLIYKIFPFKIYNSIQEVRVIYSNFFS